MGEPLTLWLSLQLVPSHVGICVDVPTCPLTLWVSLQLMPSHVGIRVDVPTCPEPQTTMFLGPLGNAWLPYNPPPPSASSQSC